MTPLDLTPDTWIDSASCASADPDLWFPEAGGLWSAHVARGICATCPVQVPCLTYALERPELQGIWGGTSESQRLGLRSGRRGAA